MSDFDWDSAEPLQGINALQSQPKGGNSLMLDIASLMPVVPQGVVDWANGVQHRMAHPLEALSDVATQWKNMNPVEMASNVLPVGATAWHGSPHLFDKFKSEAIGTGEGAQAYGHGLYLAENPKVAQSYKETLSDNKVKINGQPINNAVPDELAAAVLVQSKGDKDAAIQYLKSNLQYAKGDSITKLNNAIESLNSGRELPVAETSGALYKTDIPDAHIDKMLDWDKPLSEQHPDVQAAIKSTPFYHQAKDYYARTGHDYNNPDIKTGQSLYQYMQAGAGDSIHDGMNAVEASNQLHKAGIPGIKYLDGSSRAAGDGTRNFVIFNPDDIRILERNGQPTGQVPWNTK